MGVRIRGGFVLDEHTRSLTRRGNEVAIAPKPFDLIAYLLRHRDRMVSKQELHEVLWPGAFVSDAALAQCVARARRALGTRGGDDVIRTVHSRGFRFVAEVAFGPASAAVAPEQTAPAGPRTLTRAALIGMRAFKHLLGRADAERLRVLRAALARGGEGETLARARLLAALASELSHGSDTGKAASLIDAAVVMARRLGDAATLLAVLRSAYRMEQSPDGFERRRAMVAEMMELVAPIPEALPHYWVQLHRLPLAVEAGDRGELDRALAAVRHGAARVRDPALRWQLIRWEASRALIAGRLDEAERLCAEALALGWSVGRRDAVALYSYQLWGIRAAQDRLDELEPVARAGLARFAAIPATRAIYADLILAIGHEAHAGELLRAEARSGFASLGRDLTWLTSMVHYARVAVRLGETGPAASLYGQLAPYHSRVVSGGGVINGSVALYLGMLAALSGRYESAEAHFLEADVVHRRLQAPLWIALTGAEHARMLCRRRATGDAARAEELRRHARTLSHGRPFAAIVDRHCAAA